MTLRQATPDDLDAIMALERASFPTDAWSAAMMREELSSPHSHYVVDEEAGRLLGYAGLRAPRGARDADIQTIAIAEPARGRGRGRVLLEALLAEASARRVHDVFLEVRADNPVAQALYVSEGFTEVGRRPRYYQPDDVDAVVMRLDLAGWAAHHALTSERPADGAAIAASKPVSAGESDTAHRASASHSAGAGRNATPGTVPWQGGACT
jgi:ribosomal-protein-alanine N-acetyltransferase